MNKESISKQIDEINKKLNKLCDELNQCTDYDIELEEFDISLVSEVYPKKKYIITVTTKEVFR